jgi:hypothetical protein
MKEEEAQKLRQSEDEPQERRHHENHHESVEEIVEEGAGSTEAHRGEKLDWRKKKHDCTQGKRDDKDLSRKARELRGCDAICGTKGQERE